MRKSLLDRTRHLVETAPRSVTFTDMAKASGVSVAWVSRFASGRIPNPGIVHVQALHDYLAGLAK